MKMVCFDPSAAGEKALKDLIILLKKIIKLTTKKKLAVRTTTAHSINTLGGFIRQPLCNWICPRLK